MLENLRRLFARHRDLAELAALSDRDLADLGISREQALQLGTLPEDVPGRVAAMGRIFGLSEADLSRNRATWTELLSVCQSCRELPACKAFMERGTGGPAEAGFCPNWTEFAEIEHRS